MVVLNSGWEINCEAILVGDYVIAGNLKIPVDQVLVFTQGGEQVWVEDLVVATEHRWWHHVCGWVHTVLSKTRRK